MASPERNDPKAIGNRPTISYQQHGSVTKRSSSILPERFIHLTPQPSFPWLCGYDYRMLGGVVMLGSMLIGRAVAAERGTAGLAGAQVHPLVAGFDAFIAYIFSWLYQLGNLSKVLTNGFAHNYNILCGLLRAWLILASNSSAIFPARHLASSALVPVNNSSTVLVNSASQAAKCS